MIVARSTRICKQATKIGSKEMLQTQVGISHSENTVPYVGMKQLQNMDLRHTMGAKICYQTQVRLLVCRVLAFEQRAAKNELGNISKKTYLPVREVWLEGGLLVWPTQVLSGNGGP